MLTWEDDVDSPRTAQQGLVDLGDRPAPGRDRKTVRAYLNGERKPGVRGPGRPIRSQPFVDYVRARLGEDPHLWAITLFDELRRAGVRPVLSVADPGDPGPGAAPGVPGVRRCGDRPGERGDRASAG